jgi:6-phosphogluconolactonase
MSWQSYFHQRIWSVPRLFYVCWNSMRLKENGQSRFVARRAGVLGCLAGFAVLLAGCGQFFPPLSSTGGSGSSSGDYLYVGNLGTNPVSIGGFSLASSGLSAISGSDWNATYSPNSMVLTQNDDYLLMGTDSGEVFSFPIDSDGALGTGTVAGSLGPAAMAIDTSGDWLIGVDAFSGQVYAFALDSSNGTLTEPVSSSIATMNGCNPSSDLSGGSPGLAIAPNDDYIYVSCGTAGIYTFSFDSSSGDLTSVNSTLNPKQSGDSDFGLAISPSGDYLFAAETGIGAVRVFSISSSNGTLSEISGSPYKTATGPYGVLVDSTGSYVYVSNRTEGTISGFTISSTGTLTAISGSPFSTGSLPQQMVEDKSDTYIAVACAGGSPDLEVYTIGTGGALTEFKTATTGTDPTEATSLAVTH